jgi:hypothetical protein
MVIVSIVFVGGQQKTHITRTSRFEKSRGRAATLEMRRENEMVTLAQNEKRQVARGAEWCVKEHTYDTPS